MIKENPKYKKDAWKMYDTSELSAWVSLLMKRAGHRVEGTDALKDLKGAHAYLGMLVEKVEEAVNKEQVKESKDA